MIKNIDIDLVTAKILNMSEGNNLIKNKTKVIKLIIIITLILMLLFLTFLTIDRVNNSSDSSVAESNKTMASSIPSFLTSSFTNTNWEKVDPSIINAQNGGPGKDGIPALDDPKFVKLDEVTSSNEVQAIVVDNNGSKKVYPYNILIWHEIVNDTIGDTPVSVTFCPLCGSAIVFERQNMTFGVSGKLFESNLLMYDNLTESLWSQSKGEAIVGAKLGKKLSVYQSDIITQKEAKASFPNALSLSNKTGISRDYSRYPYGDYNESDKLIFPTSVDDKRFHPKTLLYVVPLEKSSIAFVREGLLKNMTAEKNGVEIKVMENETIQASKDGYIIPGYIEMWFSWSTHHQDDGFVWIN